MLFLTAFLIISYLCDVQVFDGAKFGVPGEIHLDESSYEKFIEYMKPVKPSVEERDIKLCEFRSDRVLGWCFELNEIGKELPITFLVCISSELKVSYIDVLKYRETRGGEIRSKVFLKQFIGKSSADSLKVGEDVRNIRGATLSAWATTRAIKKAFAIGKLINEKQVKINRLDHDNGRSDISGKTSISKNSNFRRTFFIADSFISVSFDVCRDGSESKLFEYSDFSSARRIFSDAEKFLREIESDFENYYKYGKLSERVEKLIKKYSQIYTGGYFSIFWWKNLVVPPESDNVWFENLKKRELADLSAIWKGYTVDELRKFFYLKIEEYGLQNKLCLDEINFGNSTFFFSDKLVDVYGKFFRIQNSSLSVSSSSGDYSFVFDPVSGNPVKEWREVVVIHKSAEYSDFASTLCVVAGEKCVEFLKDSVLIYSYIEK